MIPKSDYNHVASAEEASEERNAIKERNKMLSALGDYSHDQ